MPHPPRASVRRFVITSIGLGLVLPVVTFWSLVAWAVL
jgi:hypothetical protein